MTPLRQSDPSLLLPSVWQRVEVAMSLCRARGYHPVLWETLRSLPRALYLAAKGTGSVKSMHRYGAAADVICRYHAWGCKAHGCRFYQAWGESAEQAGLWWGGRWKSRKDAPHAQAAPPIESIQALVRGMPWDERDAFVASCMRGEAPWKSR